MVMVDPILSTHIKLHENLYMYLNETISQTATFHKIKDQSHN